MIFRMPYAKMAQNNKKKLLEELQKELLLII